jgi:hypothetical protein
MSAEGIYGERGDEHPDVLKAESDAVVSGAKPRVRLRMEMKIR